MWCVVVDDDGCIGIVPKVNVGEEIAETSQAIWTFDIVTF